MMNPRIKFALQVTAFATTTVILAFGLYFLFFAPTPIPTEPGTTEPETPLGGIPGASDFLGDRGSFDTPDIATETPGLQPSPIALGGRTTVTRLTSGSITSPSISGNNIAYYDVNDGRFYSIDTDGRILPISDTRFAGAEKVTFSPQADAAVLEFPDGSNILFDIEDNKQITMPAHWEDFGFSPNGGAIAGKAIADANNGQLVVMNTDGTQARAVANLGSNEDRLDVMWSPNNQFLGLSRTGQAQAGFGRNAVLLIDQEGEAPGSLIVDGTNFSAKWTPSGNHVVYSTSDPARQERPSLWYVEASGDSIGDNRRNLLVETWIEKCAFRDDNFLICAVPRTIEEFTGYDHRLSESPDDVYEINLSTGRSTLIAEPSIDVTMNNLSVSADQSTLYFTDKAGRLNTIRLR